MPVLVQCPDCRAEFRVSEADLGRPGRCQKCGREMSLLATRDSDAPPAGDTHPVWTPPRAAELAAGESFGRYRILRRLGRGGMATVYLAHDSHLERDVALKVPRFTADESPDVVKRFTREARALARFDHPNICPVYDVLTIFGDVILENHLHLIAAADDLSEAIREAILSPEGAACYSQGQRPWDQATRRITKDPPQGLEP